MKAYNKLIGSIPLITIVLLSLLGYTYSAWKDEVVISGTVEMGSLTLAFSTRESPTCSEYYLNPNPPPERIEGEWGGKDVGECNAYYDPDSLITDEHTGKQGYKVLIIEVKNAYPEYMVHTTFVIHNIGTIPIMVYGLDFSGEKRDSEGNLVYKLVAKSWIDQYGHIIGEVYEDVDDSGDVSPGDILIINLRVINKFAPLQLDPCDEEKMEIDLHFKQDAEECHTYILKFSLLGVQWNKFKE